MKFFSYLHEDHPKVGYASRLNATTIKLELPKRNRGQVLYDIPVDARDRRTLVVVDGDLLCESMSKAGSVVHSETVVVLSSRLDHIRKSRFGEPAYRIESQGRVLFAKLDIHRNFLLLPVGNTVFRRCRDERSLGPMYVLIEVTQTHNGPSVVWRNSSY